MVGAMKQLKELFESRDSNSSFSCFMAPTISWLESVVIFLSFSISSAFWYIRIFRSSTKLSSILSDFEQAVYSIQRKSYKHQAEQLVDCILYAKD